jgi:acyl-CoA thioesterase FadM
MTAPQGIGDWEHYGWFYDVEVSEDDFDDLDHIGNAAVARMLDDARSAWFRSLPGREAGYAAVVRSLSISYEHEGPRGVRPRSGVRAASRTRRSVLIEQALFDPGRGWPLATATAVHVCFDTTARAAATVPPGWLRAIEGRQGAPLPFAEPADGQGRL